MPVQFQKNQDQKKLRWNANTLCKEMSENKAHFLRHVTQNFLFSPSENLYNNHHNLEVNFEVLPATSALSMQHLEQGGTGQPTFLSPSTCPLASHGVTQWLDLLPALNGLRASPVMGRATMYWPKPPPRHQRGILPLAAVLKLR